ncbi:MAG: SDR family NAD(P)-dependent oxidoreductase [Myxococcota bacterium]
MPFPLDHRTRALVTGATRGLGLALVQSLRARGAAAVGVARRPPAKPDPHFLQADIGADSAIGLAQRAAELAGGPIDLLIHNASTLGPTPLPTFESLPEQALEHVFDVNVFGPARLTRALLGPMRAQGRGLVLAISSDAATGGYPTWGAYGASKAATDALLHSLHHELNGSGVQVSAVDPGEMNTAMHAAALPDADTATLADPADVADRILRRIEGRALPARWIASEAA